MNEQRFKEIASEAAQTDAAKVFLTKHAKKQMRTRNITLTQIKRVLVKGSFTEGPYQEASGNWKANLSAVDAGQDITVVTAIQEDESGAPVFVVTVIDKNLGWKSH